MNKFSEFMNGSFGRIVCILSAVVAALCVVFAGYDTYSIISEEQRKDKITLDENGEYNSMEDVAAYIYKYNHLPSNYMTKREAEGAGWIGGNLEAVVPGKSIGGDRFYEEYSAADDLADAEGRYYIECDVNTEGKSSRGTDRILYSNDGLVYFTSDHYRTFELEYGQEVLNEFKDIK